VIPHHDHFCGERQAIRGTAFSQVGRFNSSLNGSSGSRHDAIVQHDQSVHNEHAFRSARLGGCSAFPVGLSRLPALSAVDRVKAAFGSAHGA
jgi:hypothetical protein